MLVRFFRSLFRPDPAPVLEPQPISPKSLYDVAVTVAEQAILRSAVTGIKFQPLYMDTHGAKGSFVSLQSKTIFITPEIVELGKENLVEYVESTILFHVAYLQVQQLERKLERMQELRNKALMTFDRRKKLDLFLSERNLGYWIAKEAREGAKELNPSLSLVIDEVAADRISLVEDVLDAEIRKIDVY